MERRAEGKDEESEGEGEDNNNKSNNVLKGRVEYARITTVEPFRATIYS